MPDKKLLSQVRAIFFRSKEMIVVLSLFFCLDSRRSGMADDKGDKPPL